jgi:hypothetical protein
MDTNRIFCYYKNKNLNSLETQGIILEANRKIRFELFIILFYSTLHRDMKTAFEVFKEAYCLTDNIHTQIQNSTFKFNLRLFLKDVQNNNVKVPDLMNNWERDYYDQLPQSFYIYRGMNRKEYKSKRYGISWSRDKQKAEQYIFYDKNNSEEGGLASLLVKKEDILTIFNDGENFELIYLHNQKWSLDILKCLYHKILNWRRKIILNHNVKH